MLLRKERESTMEKAAVNYALEHGWESVKLDKVRKSWPDQIFIGEYGDHFFVEFKREGKVPTFQQDAVHMWLRDTGHDIYVIDSFEKFKALLNDRRVEKARQRLRETVIDDVRFPEGRPENW